MDDATTGQSDDGGGGSTANERDGDPTVDERTIANARGALGVVRTTSATVDDQLDAIAERTGAQASDATTVVGEVSDLSATVEEIAGTAAEVSRRSDRAATQAAEGRASAREAVDVMDDVRGVSGTVAEEVETLQRQIDRIETALAGIDDIADQTNILALNASIEAARADSNGDGFAVVADEVKSLAEDVQRQSSEIDTVLGEVRTVADETVARLENAVEEIDRGTARVEETMERLDTIAEAVEETAAGTRAVSDATDEQAQTTESVAERVERVADRAVAIEDDVTTIDDARSEQTEMLDEIHDALQSAAGSRANRLEAANRIPTGIDGIDRRGSGFLVGGRAVLRHDSTAVDGLIARFCSAALDAGRCVSVTVPPTLSRPRLADALAASGHSIDAVLREDRLFVLDPFGGWADEYNVFDLGRRSLAATNRTTNERRERPLFVVGNVAGEIAVMGESAAREARYANDDGVLGEDDTVLNVVDTTAVSDRFAAFYTGAADQVFDTTHDGTAQRLELTETANGDAGPSCRVRTHELPSSPAE